MQNFRKQVRKIAAGIICLIVGIIIILVTKYSMNAKITVIVGVIFCSIGVLSIYIELFGQGPVTQILLMWLICGSFGGFMTYMGGVHIYTKLFCCRSKTDGTFLQLVRYWHRNTASYSLQFSYRIGNRTYVKSSFESYSFKGRLEKKYIANQEYPIYVDPKHPDTFVVKRRLFLNELVIFCVGILILGVAVCETIKYFGWML